ISNYKIAERVGIDNLFHFFVITEAITNYMFNVTSNTLQFHMQGTVSASAMEIAINLGCRKVILVGQDLSYPNDKFYADGVDHFDETELEKQKQEGQMEIENVQGGMNTTTKSMNMLLMGIEGITRAYSEYCEFINTSSIGAKIEDTHQKPLLSFMEEMKKFTVDRKEFSKKLKDHNFPYSEKEKREVHSRLKS